jgi:hypothetical protein
MATTQVTRLKKISNIIHYLIELRHILFLNFFLNTILSAFSMPSLSCHHKLSDRNVGAEKAEPFLTISFPIELWGVSLIHPPKVL